MPRPQIPVSEQINSAKLRSALGSATYALLCRVVKEAERQRLLIYLVGGLVRDLLLGRRSQDLDLVVEGDAIRFGRRLVEKFGGRLVMHKPFGTAVWWLRRESSNSRLPEFIDLISARSETYAHPAALPNVKFDDIRADQHRRDFTINTLALRLDGPAAGHILDPWGGLSDLKAGLLRTLHPRSFSDDPTRIFRLLRFAGRLGFKIERSTASQLTQYLPHVKRLSGERIRNELELILGEEKRVAILRAAQGKGVLRQVHPGLRFPHAATARMAGHISKPASYWELPDFTESHLAFVLWLMFLSPRTAASIAERLRFETPLRTAIVSAAQLRVEVRMLVSLPPSQLVAGLEREPMLAVYALFLMHEGKALGKKLDQFARRLRHVRPHINGNELRKLGVPPGPTYKKILARLRAARLDGEVRTARQERALLETLLHGSR